MKNIINFRGGLYFLNKDVVFTFVFYFLIISLGIFGVIHAQSVDHNDKYLFVSPSYVNDTSLTWTTSVWAGVLGIHGTIAALSITFMGMFVNQVSSYSESGFEDICKSLLLSRSNFLSFSLNSILSLLTGVILLASGGGMIAYVISVFVSLCFIFNYGLMYLKLYGVTENPTIIREFLFSDLKDKGEGYYSSNMHLQELVNNFDSCCNKLNFIENGWSSDVITLEQRALEIFTDKNNLLLYGFCAECLKEINELIKNNVDDNKFKLRISLNFNQNISYSSFNIEYKKGVCIDENIIYQLENMLERTFLTRKMAPEKIVLYHKYEQAVIQNIRNSLFKGDEMGVDFSVKALFTLTEKNDVVRTMNGLDHSFGYSNKKNRIDYAIFAVFFEKVSSELLLKGDFKKAREVMGGIINLGRFLYTADYFYEFYHIISRSLQDRARYGFSDDDFSMFDLYVHTTRQNLVTQNYMAFELNTQFLTKEFQYLESADDGESLSAIENKMVQCVRNIVTLILIRLTYIKGKKKHDSDEFYKLCNYLRSWSNAAFFEDVYYKEGTYDALFTIPRELDFDASRTLREIPDYETASISMSNDTFRAIVFLMTQSPINNNNFNPVFIRNKKDFLEKTGISTHQLQSIITYLKSDEFSEILDAIEKNSSDNSNRTIISDSLESIVIEKNNLITEEIIESELNDELVQKYINEVTISFEKHLNKVLNANMFNVSDDVSSESSYSVINKREVMKSIDGVHYSMNAGHHAELGIYHWIRSVLNKVKLKPRNIIAINNPNELPTEKLVTINYKVKGESGIFRYCRGLRVSDNDGVLALGASGLYFMDFENEFSFIKGQTLFDVLIENVTSEKIESIGGASIFGEANPFLYALMILKINLELIERNQYNFYFLSVEKCKELTQLSDRKVHLSLDKGALLNESKSIS